MDDETETAAGATGADTVTAGGTPDSGDAAGRRRGQVGPAVLPVVDEAHYALGGEHARGGLGRILLASDRRLDRPVAVKELLRESAENRARFVREARITARLQHPGIVPIYEAGRWPSGQPFYAMKLVAGRPLSEVIADSADLEARLALLPKVLAVAEAVAYAHSRRVVHRDLKPGNVLIGDYGETVVIDWGLAKDLDHPEEAPEPGATATAATAAADPVRKPDSGGVTVAGQVLGTPSYMAPEQARGEPVGIAADVYALGAILYHLLAGAPPYRTESAGAPRSVLDGPPLPLPSLVPGVPRDLATLVAKAMARDPAARYPSAADLAADLGRFTRGQLVAAHRYGAAARLRRFLSRHRVATAAVALAAIAVAITITFSLRRVLSERDIAQAERTRAVTQRRAAEDLVDYVLTEQRVGLRGLGKLDLIEGVGQRIAAYYRELGADGRDLRGRRHRAVALTTIGEALRSRGKLEEALPVLREALTERLAVLAEAAPGSADWIADLRPVIGLFADLTNLAIDRGEAASAAGAAAMAMGLILPAAVTHPDDRQLQEDLAQVHDELGSVLRQYRNEAAARDVFRRALAILERVPPRPSSDHLRLTIQSRLITVELLTGATAQAIERLPGLLAVARRRVAAEPDNMRVLDDLVAALYLQAHALRRVGDLVPAQAALREARELAQRLVAREPGRIAWQRRVVMAANELGQVELDRGDFAAADASLAEALALSRQLVDHQPGNGALWLGLARVHHLIGRVAEQRRDKPAAWAAFTAAVEAAQRARTIHPDNPDADQLIASLEGKLGDAASAMGRHAEAASHFRGAIAVVEPHVARNPRDMDRRGYLASLKYTLAMTLLEVGDTPAALAAAREGLALADAAVAEDAGQALSVQIAAEARSVLAQCLSRSGDRAGALRAFDEAIAALQALEKAGKLTHEAGEVLSDCIARRADL